MKRGVFLVPLLLFLGLPAHAQTSHPRYELFGGYSYSRLDPRLGLAGRENVHGWAVSLSRNFFRHFGVTADFASHDWDGQVLDPKLVCIQVFPPPPECLRRASGRNYQFSAGPRVVLRAGRWTGFAHALVGLDHTRFAGVSGDDLVLSFGGGMDTSLGSFLGLRLVQFDYVRVAIDLADRRFRTGIVLKVGGF